jgi:hypothetical protein
VLGEPEQQITAVAGRTEGLTQRGGELGEHLDRRRCRLGVPVAAAGRGLADQGHRVLGRPGVASGLLAGGHQVGDVRHPGAGHGAGGHAGPAVDERDDDDAPRAHRPVGGQAVARPAEVGLGALDDERDLAVCRRCRQGPLDDLLRSGPTHRPASWTVLRMLTFSNSADGHPWLTGAVCPGWALPQLKAPPST